MAKAVTYSVVGRKNPAKKTDPVKYYAQAQAQGEVNLTDMSVRIEEKCSLHTADVLATLKALENEWMESLRRGEIIRFGDIGSFQIALRSKGAATREKFTAQLIKSVRVLFRPTRQMNTQLKGVHFEKVSRRGHVDVVPDDGDEAVDPLAK